MAGSYTSAAMTAENRKQRLTQAVIVINIIFWLCGAIVLGAAIWLRVDSSLDTPLGVYGGSSSFFLPSLILMSVGCVMTVTGCLACFAAFCSLRHVLLVYFVVLLLLVVAAQIAAGICAHFVSRGLGTDITHGMRVMLLTEYGREGADPQITDHVDDIQQKYRCCGVQGPGDWATSHWALHVQPRAREKTVPNSCCRDTECSFTSSSVGGAFHPDWRNNKDVFTEGCAGYLTDFLSQRLVIVILLGAVFACVQLLGVVVVITVIFCLYGRSQLGAHSYSVRESQHSFGSQPPGNGDAMMMSEMDDSFTNSRHSEDPDTPGPIRKEPETGNAIRIGVAEV